MSDKGLRMIPLEQMPKTYQVHAERAARAMTRYIRENGLDPNDDELLADISFDEAAARIGTPVDDENEQRFARWLDWRTHVEQAVRAALTDSL